MSEIKLTDLQRVGVDGSGAMFDGIAQRYDLLNRLMTFGIDRRWRRLAVARLSLPPNGMALDLATGTADMTLEMVRQYPQCQVIGVDPSRGMLEVGRQKVERLRMSPRIHLQEGDAQALAFPDNHFDGSCIAFGIRNVPDRLKALKEMNRVVRPSGRVVVLELSEPTGGLLGTCARLYVHHVIPRLGALISGAPEYRYLQQSIQHFPPAPVFAELLEEAGLKVLEVTPLLFGVAHLYVAAPGGR